MGKRKKLKRLEARVARLESMMVGQMFGLVEIQGVPHLLECEKRNDEKKACTCGAIPVGCSNRKKEVTDE